MGTAIAGLMVAAAAVLAVRTILKDKKSGKGCGGCKGGCAHCSSHCPTDKK